MCTCVAEALWQAGLWATADTSQEPGPDTSWTPAQPHVTAGTIRSLRTGQSRCRCFETL